MKIETKQGWLEVHYRASNQTKRQHELSIFTNHNGAIEEVVLTYTIPQHPRSPSDMDVALQFTRNREDNAGKLQRLLYSAGMDIHTPRIDELEQEDDEWKALSRSGAISNASDDVIFMGNLSELPSQGQLKEVLTKLGQYQILDDRILAALSDPKELLAKVESQARNITTLHNDGKLDPLAINAAVTKNGGWAAAEDIRRTSKHTGGHSPSLN